jgi:hypothetical protein
MATVSKAQNSAIPLPIIRDHYPRSCSVADPLSWRPVHFQAIGVRDLVADPLTIEQFLRRPYLRRSRYQLRVVDLATGRRRTIYERLLRENFRDCPLRVGVYEGRKLVELMATNYGPSVADRRGLLRFLAKYSTTDFGDYRLGILSDDGEVVTVESLA